MGDGDGGDSGSIGGDNIYKSNGERGQCCSHSQTHT